MAMNGGRSRQYLFVLSANKLHPGQRVFVDDVVHSTQGRKFEGQGASNNKQNARVRTKDKLFGGGCVFMSAASGHIEVKFQTCFSTKKPSRLSRNVNSICLSSVCSSEMFVQRNVHTQMAGKIQTRCACQNVHKTRWKCAVDPELQNR